MKKLALLGIATVVLLAAWLAPFAAHHLLPLSWTGEAARLAGVIGAVEGATVAEIGAGAGGMAREIAAIVGPRGKLFVTEMAAAQREALAAIARDEGLPQMVVVEAQAEATNLPSACCSAVYMRHVLHHIDNWPRYAVDLARTVQPGGIVAVIDFAPGALPHLTADHGAGPDRVVEAFAGVGLRLTNRDDNWGGGTYLLAFRRPE